MREHNEENKKRQTVLVLGATGNLGAYSALALKDAGYDVIAAGHRKSDNGFFEERDIPYHSIDLTEKTGLDCLLTEHIDTVADFAGELPSRCVFNPQMLIRSITEATLNVLEFMIKVGAGKIIFPTTPYDLFYLHETGMPIDPDAPRSFPQFDNDHSIYAIAKNAAVDLIEYYHNTCGISRFILRHFTIYQYHPNAYHFDDYKVQMMPYRKLIDMAEKSLPITIYGNPERMKEMVYIKDYTKVVVAAAQSESEGGFYNIGSPSRVTLNEMIHGIVEVFSPDGNKSDISYDRTKSDTLQSILNWDKTRTELGYNPEYTFLRMMRDFKEEMHAEPFAKLWGTRQYYDNIYRNMIREE